ncbi:MAG TPA: hypothetical protein VKM93_16855 [Terriglobia bacterium]|nr:hypothetical protein [Terriglobia bacterium]
MPQRSHQAHQASPQFWRQLGWLTTHLALTVAPTGFHGGSQALQESNTRLTPIHVALQFAAVSIWKHPIHVV